METRHWIFIIIALIVGYFLGIKFPSKVGTMTGFVPSVSP